MRKIMSVEIDMDTAEDLDLICKDIIMSKNKSQAIRFAVKKLAKEIRDARKNNN
jgi:hypothetical protein